MYKEPAEKVRELTVLLNCYRDEYYNKNAPSVSDAEYDQLYDELEALEKETGCVMSNSPTHTVGYPVVSGLVKTQHPTPLLSLEKTKSTGELMKFIGNRSVLLMHKLDGLTVKLEYDGGKFLGASTRGDGHEGEDITHNIRAFRDVPMNIPYQGKLTVTGEWRELGSDMRLMLEIEHYLGIEWFVNGKYDKERHKRYDLGLSTVMRATVDPSLHMIIGLQWADPWKNVMWREVAIPTDILRRYGDLVQWRERWEKPDFAALGIPANSLLFFRKVNFPDGRVMYIRLESGEDDCWLFGRLLDRAGKELVSDYFRFFPVSFILQYGDTRYEAMIREETQHVKNRYSGTGSRNGIE